MERVIQMGERLQRLLEEAEREAEKRVAEAQRRADEMIARAKEEAESRRVGAQRGYGIDNLLHAEEDKANKESGKILEDHGRKAEAMKNVPPERFEEAVSLVLREVLPR